MWWSSIAVIVCVSKCAPLPGPRAGVAFAAADVEVKHWFPENPTGEFVAGTTVKSVLGVHNAGSSSVNVSYASAQLFWPTEPSSPIYNFTSQASGWVAGPFVRQ